MNQLGAQVWLKGVMRPFCIGRSQYPALLQMYQNGAYMELYNNIYHSVPIRGSLMAEVRKNYQLYPIALLMGDMEKADEHKKFVMQNGGTLWYRAELEA